MRNCKIAYSMQLTFRHIYKKLRNVLSPLWLSPFYFLGWFHLIFIFLLIFFLRQIIQWMRKYLEVLKFNKDFVFVNWQLMSALTSLERILFFIKWRSCKHCLQSEWPLMNNMLLQSTLDLGNHFGDI